MFPATALNRVLVTQPKRRKASSDFMSRKSRCRSRRTRNTAHGMRPSMALTTPAVINVGRSGLVLHGVAMVARMMPTAAHGPNVMQARTAMAVAGKRMETPFSISKLNANLLQIAKRTNVTATCPRRVRNDRIDCAGDCSGGIAGKWRMSRANVEGVTLANRRLFRPHLAAPATIMTLMHFETLAVHGGTHARDEKTGDVAPPIHLSTTFVHSADSQPDHGYIYVRDSNPNGAQLEESLARIESGHAALAFSSGMAAATAALQSLPPGSHALLPDDSYYGVP